MNLETRVSSNSSGHGKLLMNFDGNSVHQLVVGNIGNPSAPKAPVVTNSIPRNLESRVQNVMAEEDGVLTNFMGQGGTKMQLPTRGS